MREHPSWRSLSDSDRSAFRVFRASGATWVAYASDTEPGIVSRLLGAPKSQPEPEWFSWRTTPSSTPSEIDLPSQGVGIVGRFRNYDLWDALGTTIIRQVIRASQSKKLYRQYCETHGERIATTFGAGYLFPSPEATLALTSADFASLGLSFKMRPLHAAAAAYIRERHRWHDLSPHELLAELQSVPHIGPWTAGAAIADYTNDWSLYPYSDLAVRKWARHLFPMIAWPDNEDDFSNDWRARARGDVSTLTLLTLAAGSRHGDIG